MQNFYIKLDRLAAWTLFFGMILYFISGYGMLKGFIDPALATKIHLDFLTYIIMIAFTIHAFYAIRLAFIRWGVWNVFSKIMLAIFFICFLGFFIYLDKFYEKEVEKIVAPIATVTSKPIPSSSKTNSVSTSPTPTTSLEKTESDVKTFTKDELSKYDGLNGNPAYVAVDGNVYDLTKVFKEGSHFSHYAGTELTNAFYSYHAKSVLGKYPIVGELRD